MAKVHDGIDADMAAWIAQQPLFFVATAPLAADGLVNLSPKGETGTFRVVDAHTFAYLDLTGSGIETVAHLRENGRVCVMFCAFDGKPKIVRLHGAGRVVTAEDPGFEEALAGFGEAARIEARCTGMCRPPAITLRTTGTRHSSAFERNRGIRPWEMTNATS